MSHHHQTPARRSHRSHCTARNALPFRAHNRAVPPSTASHYNRAVNSPHFVGVDHWHAAKSFVRNSRASKRYQWQRERSQSQRFAVASGCPPARRWCLSGAVGCPVFVGLRAPCPGHCRPFSRISNHLCFATTCSRRSILTGPTLSPSPSPFRRQKVVQHPHPPRSHRHLALPCFSNRKKNEGAEYANESAVFHVKHSADHS